MDSLFSFDLVDILFYVITFIFVFVIGIRIYKWNKNENSPKITVDARIISKRSKVKLTGLNCEENISMFSLGPYVSAYYIPFETEDGEEKEMNVNVTDYRRFFSGDFGKLTFQGNRYLSFERCAR